MANTSLPVSSPSCVCYLTRLIGKVLIGSGLVESNIDHGERYGHGSYAEVQIEYLPHRICFFFFIYPVFQYFFSRPAPASLRISLRCNAIREVHDHHSTSDRLSFCFCPGIQRKGRSCWVVPYTGRGETLVAIVKGRASTKLSSSYKYISSRERSRVRSFIFVNVGSHWHKAVPRLLGTKTGNKYEYVESIRHLESHRVPGGSHAVRSIFDLPRHRCASEQYRFTGPDRKPKRDPLCTCILMGSCCGSTPSHLFCKHTASVVDSRKEGSKQCTAVSGIQRHLSTFEPRSASQGCGIIATITKEEAW